MNGLLEAGVAARAIDLPRRRAEEAASIFEAAILAGSVLPGGHSFGGRVASLATATLLASGERIPGLVLLSYPLHRPGDPDGWVGRTAHWGGITCPVLLLSGESDPFARIALLRTAVDLLPNAELVTYPRVGHGLLRVLPDAVGRIADFVRSLERRSAATGRA